jgi:hypothetical protein
VGLLLGLVVLAGRLYRTGLYRRYRIFFVYVLFRVPMTACVLLLSIKSNAYFYFWIGTEPLTWLFYVWVVLELCQLTLERHQGLYTLGKWAIYCGMALSVTISVISVLPRLGPTPQSHIMGYVMGADRGVTLTLAIFVVLMLFLLTQYPVPLNRNVVLHVTVFTAFFLSNTLSMLAHSVFGLNFYSTIDAGMAVVASICVVVWAFFLAPRGEDVRVQVPHFAPEHEERILYHLNALNATVLKVAHK